MNQKFPHHFKYSSMTACRLDIRTHQGAMCSAVLLEPLQQLRVRVGGWPSARTFRTSLIHGQQLIDGVSKA